MDNVDIFKVINQQLTLKKHYRVQDLDIVRNIDNSDHEVEVEINGEFKKHNNKNYKLIHVKINGNINLICQRCNQPMQHKLSITNTLEVLNNIESLQKIELQEEEYDMLVGSENFEIPELIREEILLCLPPFPTHEICVDNQYLAADDGPESPFAILESIKSKSNTDINT